MQIPAVMVWLTCDGGETYKRCTLGNINQFHRHVFFTFADTDASTGARTSTSSGGSYSYGVQVTFLCIWGTGGRRRRRRMSSGEGAGLLIRGPKCSDAEASSGCQITRSPKIRATGWLGVTGIKGDGTGSFAGKVRPEVYC